jgi:hypothetical protein
MSDYQVEALRNNPKVSVIESDSIAKLFRNEHGKPERIETANGKTLPASLFPKVVRLTPMQILKRRFQVSTL